MISKSWAWPTLALVAATLPLHAQENERAIERLEITMTLLPEQAENAAQVIQRIIDLPPPPAEAAGNDGNDGKPDEIPGAERGRGEGLETAAEARELGREFGQNVAADARENRENAGRGSDAPGRPDDLPSPPIERPTPPQNPGRP